MELLHEDDDIRISIEPGDSDVTIVAFGGISYGTIELGEFRNTLANTHSSNNVLFVLDKNRKWFNGPHQIRINDLLSREIERLSPNYVYTLGNSMGGAGALLYAATLPKCRRALAFCPQSSVNSEVVPFETRWNNYRKDILDWTVPDIVPSIAPACEYFIFYGAKDDLDLKHAQRFQNSSAHVYVVPDCTHDVAVALKRRRLLTTIVKSIISEIPIDKDPLASVLKRSTTETG